MTEQRFLVGGYTADSGGIAAGIGLAQTMDDGRLEYLGTVARVPSPSWLLGGDGRVFAASESTGDLVTLRAEGGALVEAGRVSTDGVAPCHLAFSGEVVVASAYGSGTVSWHPLVGGVAGPASRVSRHSGFGPHPDQGSARAHASLSLPDGRVLVADLGADAVVVYSAGGAERLGAVALPPGTGPRDLHLLDDGRVLLLGELDGTLHALDVGTTDAAPELLASVRLPGMQPRTHAASIAVHAGVAYLGLRRANRVAVVDVRDGALEPIGDVDCGGDWPRFLTVDGPATEGVLHVANQFSSTVASFRATPGALPEPLGAATRVPSPSHLAPLSGTGLEGLQPLIE